MTSTAFRASCGTYPGLALHQELGEDPCSKCLSAEAARKAFATSEAGQRLLAEAIPCRPTRPGLEPVTPEQAEANRNLLDREVAAYEKSHSEPRPHLRAVV